MGRGVKMSGCETDLLTDQRLLNSTCLIANSVSFTANTAPLCLTTVQQPGPIMDARLAGTWAKLVLNDLD